MATVTVTVFRVSHDDGTEELIVDDSGEEWDEASFPSDEYENYEREAEAEVQARVDFYESQGMAVNVEGP